MKAHRHGAQQNADPAMGLPLSPIARPPLIDGLESVHSQTLRSGVRVVSLNLPEAPLICLDLWCRAGSAFETAEESGMAHFLEHMVFKGSERQEAGDFDLKIEALGGHSNAATGFDDVHYHVLVPPTAAAEACELLLDLVLNPRLDQEDLDVERQVVLEELAQSQDQPDEMALQTLLQLGCCDHPYGRAILGERDLLQEHTADTMRRFQQRLYGAQHCVLAVSGPLDARTLDTLVAQLERSPLATLPRTTATPPPPQLRLQPGVHHRPFARLEAARLLMAWSLPGASERQAVAAMDLATSLLAEGRRSRLVARLREELRLVESIDLDLQVLECGSLALLEAVCDPAELPIVRQQIERVLMDSHGTPPPVAEIERGRKLVANGYRFGLEAAAGVAGVIGNGALWDRPSDLNDPLRALRAVDADQLQQSFALLDPSRACVLEAVPA
jgi:predicted Zn-dependent peptidase